MMICRFKDTYHQCEVYMEAITEEQEKDIDDSTDEYENLHFIKDNKVIAKGKEIILYGEVDLNNPIDLNYIQKFNLIDEEHSWIYSNINFDTGDVSSVNGIIQQHPTFNPIKWFKYCHLLIGKPKRIIIYKTPKNRHGHK